MFDCGYGKPRENLTVGDIRELIKDLSDKTPVVRESINSTYGNTSIVNCCSAEVSVLSSRQKESIPFSILKAGCSMLIIK